MDTSSKHVHISPSKVKFRREIFEVEHHVYVDKITGETSTDDYLDFINLTQVQNQYREKYNLPFPNEIKRIREQYDLSASRMSEILGFGINVYRSYEHGEIPSESNARLIQLAKNPEEFLMLVKLSKFLSDREREKLCNRIEALISQNRLVEKERWFTDYLIGEAVPNSYTGYQTPNLKKFSHMVLYFAQKVKPYKTKLNKLLFYADFLNYKRQLASISGARYIAIKMGPVPDGFDSLFKFAEQQGLIQIAYEWFNDHEKNERYGGERYLPRPGVEFDKTLFSEDELDALEAVAQRFKASTTRDIIDLSHEELAWLENEGSLLPIDYRFSFHLKNIK